MGKNGSATRLHKKKHTALSWLCSNKNTGFAAQSKTKGIQQQPQQTAMQM
jgi:hypothetical protein